MSIMERSCHGDQPCTDRPLYIVNCYALTFNLENLSAPLVTSSFGCSSRQNVLRTARRTAATRAVDVSGRNLDRPCGLRGDRYTRPSSLRSAHPPICSRTQYWPMVVHSACGGSDNWYHSRSSCSRDWVRSGGRRGSCSSCESHEQILWSELTSAGTRCRARDRPWTSSLTGSIYPLVQGKIPPCRREIWKRIFTLRTYWSGSDCDYHRMGDSYHRYALPYTRKPG